MDLPVDIIREPDQLIKAVQEMGNSEALAVDTEANRRHRYPEQLCLIQIATLHKIYIIDTILIKEIDSYWSDKIHSKNDVNRINKKCRSHYYLWGGIKTRMEDGEKYYLELNFCIPANLHLRLNGFLISSHHLLIGF